MLSRSQQKLLRKLSAKKYRQQYKMFVAEGRKVVAELLEEGLKVEFLLATEDSQLSGQAVLVSSNELRQWSQLEVADEMIAVFHFPDFEANPSNLVLVLDGIKDPGNLGTIIRTCDWFGASQIFCTTGTVDVFNTKTVQSTMGSIARVAVNYASSEGILKKLQAENYQLLCADMQGQSISEVKTEGKTALVMGSESHGPSAFWKEHSTAVTIPRQGSSKTESLNVGVAAGILMAGLKGA